MIGIIYPAERTLKQNIQQTQHPLSEKHLTKATVSYTLGQAWPTSSDN